MLQLGDRAHNFFQLDLAILSPLRDFLLSCSPEGEFLVVALASLLIGWMVYRLFCLLIAGNIRLKQIIRSSAHGLGISRSATLFVATLAYEAIAIRLGLPRLFEQQPHQWVIFARIIAFGWLLSVAFQSALTIASERGPLGERPRKILVPFALKLGSAIILIVALLTAFSVLGMNVWGMAAGLGLGGIAVAFAAKDSVENLFGSATVMIDMPFGVGDWVKVGEIEGVVEEINLRSTRIRTFEDSLTTLPNSTFIKSPVENVGQRRSRRIRTTIHLNAPISSDQIASFTASLAEAIKGMTYVQPESVVVALFELRETGTVVQIVARFAIDTYREELECRQNMLLAAISLAAERGLQLKAQSHENLLASTPASHSGPSPS